MSSVGNWTIPGDNQIARALRAAAPYVETTRPITMITAPGDVPAGAFAIGPAVLLSDVERVVPYFNAFEAIEEVKRSLEAGEAGRIYGCFTSMRVPRSMPADNVQYNALLPAVAVTLDLIQAPVARVHTTRSALLAEGDAWFVSLRFVDDVIATVEALAVLDPAAGLERDLLVEITGSERVLRAEPMRQSVVVSPLGGTSVRHPWWEDLAERYLQLLARRAEEPHGNAGSRVRAVWSALQESAASGRASTL